MIFEKKKQQLLDGNRNWTVFFPVRAHVCPPEVTLEEFQWLHGCTAWTWRIIMWIMPPCMNMIPWRGCLWPKRHIHIRCSMMHTHYNVMMSVQEASRGLGRRDNPAFSNILLAHFPRFFHHMWSLKPPLNSSQLRCLGAFCHVDVSICCFRPDWRLLKQLMDVSGRPPPRDYVYIFPNSVSQFVLW